MATKRATSDNGLPETVKITDSRGTYRIVEMRDSHAVLIGVTGDDAGKYRTPGLHRILDGDGVPLADS